MNRSLLQSLLVLFSVLGAHALFVPRASARDLPPEARQFDFWVGVWDVNLRMIQDDLSWRDSVQARAQIFPVLDGKAVLELWDSPRINGWSLRYFDRARGEWVLWLNWPAPNGSGLSTLSGRFRHGRGEFFATRKRDDGTELLSRYTFSDVTPSRLRWDDAFSLDGGKTWTHNWIMEFSRTGERPTWPAGAEGHTFAGDGRCDQPAYRTFERLAGRWRGTVVDADGTERPARLEAWKILRGCAVQAFLHHDSSDPGAESIHHLTVDSRTGRWVDARLDDGTDTPLERLFGTSTGDVIRLETEPGGREDPLKREVWRLGQDRIVLREERQAVDGWTLVREARFEPANAPKP